MSRDPKNPRSLANLKPPWPKGVSGNPGGRVAKVRAITDIAEDNGAAAITQLVRLMKSKDEKVALAAAQSVLDRAAGKPKQTMDIKNDVTHHGSEPVSDTDRWIEETLRARADSKAAEPGTH